MFLVGEQIWYFLFHPGLLNQITKLRLVLFFFFFFNAFLVIYLHYALKVYQSGT